MMTEAEIDAFAAEAWAELQAKQGVLTREHGFGAGGRWAFDQATQRLQLFDAADALAVSAEALFVGTFASAASTWMWGWSNPSLLAAVRERAGATMGLAARTGLPIFERDGAFRIEGEAMAWQLTGMAVKHLGALGCYRAPAGASLSFLAVMAVERA